jgi:hypothetical protein
MTSWLGLDADDERLVGGFMSKVAGLPGPAALPDPMQLWWKAQLLRRWDAERRVQQPLEVMERVEIAAGLVAAGLLLVLSLPSLVRLLSGSLLGGLG